MSTAVSVKEISWPECAPVQRPEPISEKEYLNRLARVRNIMKDRSLSHLIVYGDREHFANLVYMTGYDPRFEESILILPSDKSPILLVGNEGMGYCRVSPLVRSGAIRTELFQSLSLQSQLRGKSRFISDIFKSEDISKCSSVGICGIKFYEAGEIAEEDASRLFDIPSYIVDSLRNLAGYENVANVTDILTHPSYGLRSKASAAELAFFEYTNSLVAENIRKLMFSLEEGMTDIEVMKSSELYPLPLGCHAMFSAGDNYSYGMSSPTGELLKRGTPAAFNICRAGWLVSDESELPAAASDYLDAFAYPYFSAMAEWLKMMKIGTPGGDIFSRMTELLPFDKFGIMLNPGHLIHLDEWIGSPVFEGSEIPMQSGMVFQSDIIPASPVYASSRMEEGYFLADEILIKEIKTGYPDMYKRLIGRRNFMKDVLGIILPDELYPLSDVCGIVSPFLFSPGKALYIKS